MTDWLRDRIPFSLKLFLKRQRARFFDQKHQNQKHIAHQKQESVIVFDDLLPTPDLDAGSARMLLILQILAKRYNTVFVYRSKNADPRYEQALVNEGIESVNLIYYPEILKRQKFETAILSRPDLAQPLLRSLRKLAPETKIIFDSVDAHFRRLERQYRISGDGQVKRKAERYRQIELDVVRRCDIVWCTSEEDRVALTAEVPERSVAIIPTIHPLHGRGRSFDERRNLLFIGNFNHSPNRDAVVYFVEQVLPLIRLTLADIQFDVVGSYTPENFRSYQSNGVRVHGYVPDIEPLFQSTRVFVAPIRFGAGVKGKIGDALSYGVPVVTTDVGAEGMRFQGGQQVLIANTPEDFARAVCEAYSNKELWQKLSNEGQQHIARYFSPAAVERTILESVG